MLRALSAGVISREAQCNCIHQRLIKKKTSSAGNKITLTPLIPVYLLETLNSLLNKKILAFQA